MTPPAFFTIGYGRWPAAARGARLVAALRAAEVSLLVDIRHSPCASNLDPASPYGPKETSLQAAGAGIVPLLQAGGIGYLWLVQLGNPQRQDPQMRILKEHLAAGDGSDWPVAHGLRRAKELVLAGERITLMCACPKYAGCHRKPVAEALLRLLPAGTEHRDLSG